MTATMRDRSANARANNSYRRSKGRYSQESSGKAGHPTPRHVPATCPPSARHRFRIQGYCSRPPNRTSSLANTGPVKSRPAARWNNRAGSIPMISGRGTCSAGSCPCPPQHSLSRKTRSVSILAATLSGSPAAHRQSSRDAGSTTRISDPCIERPRAPDARHP